MEPLVKNLPPFSYFARPLFSEITNPPPPGFENSSKNYKHYDPLFFVPPTFAQKYVPSPERYEHPPQRYTVYYPSPVRWYPNYQQPVYQQPVYTTVSIPMYENNGVLLPINLPSNLSSPRSEINVQNEINVQSESDFPSPRSEISSDLDPSAEPFFKLGESQNDFYLENPDTPSESSSNPGSPKQKYWRRKIRVFTKQ